MKRPKKRRYSLESPASRRAFVATLTKAVGTSVLMAAPGVGMAQWHAKPAMTVGQVIDLILQTIPGAPFPKTVDTLKAGTLTQPVSGIVTTTFATLEVIDKTTALGANFIIAHEPTYYNHLDETDWLEQDKVYQSKRDLLKKRGIAIWRFHDYWHSHQPDGVQTGVLTALGWTKYVDSKNSHLVNLPPTPLRDIIAHAKSKLGISTVRMIGDLGQSCQRLLLAPGAAGGRRQIEALQQTKPDVMVCGELSEWETAEYVRDARHQGQQLSLIVLGHAVSEEPGMQWLVPWLQPKLPDVKVTHVPSLNPFTFA